MAEAKKDFKKALNAFEGLYDISTDEAIQMKARLSIADAYFEDGNTDAALMLYQDIIRLFSGAKYSDYAQLRIGLSKLKNRDYDGAVKAFDDLEREFPKTLLKDEAMYNKAFAYFLMGEVAVAEGILRSFTGYFKESKYYKDVYMLLINGTFDIR